MPAFLTQLVYLKYRAGNFVVSIAGVFQPSYRIHVNMQNTHRNRLDMENTHRSRVNSQTTHRVRLDA